MGTNKKIGRIIVVIVGCILIIFGLIFLFGLSEPDWYTYLISSILAISIGGVLIWLSQRRAIKTCPRCSTPYKGKLDNCQKCGAILRKPPDMPWQNAVVLTCYFFIFVGLILLIFAIFEDDRSFFLMFGALLIAIGGIPLWLLIRSAIKRCPKCRTPYKGKLDYCQKCSAPLRKSLIPTPVQPPTPIYKNVFSFILGSIGCLVISLPLIFGISGIFMVIGGIIERDITVGIIGGVLLALCGIGYFWLSKADLP
jgi:hypothetical protein